MLKSVIKEFLIMLLILIMICLILVIILYDYNPTTKNIPKVSEEYVLQADIQEELSETLDTTTQNIVKTYTIDSQDLNAYENKNEYVKYKQNPFRTNTGSSSSTPEEDATNGIIKNTGK